MARRRREGKRMLTAAEIERKLFGQAECFETCMRAKDYPRAKQTYDIARDVALFVGLEEEKRLQLFGTRQQDPPIEGMFKEDDVQKAYYEVAVKRQQEEERVRADMIMRRSMSANNRRNLEALKRTLRDE